MVSWQAVALAVLPALVAGSGAVGVAWLNIRSQRREQLRTRRLEIASDFARRFVGASDAVRFAIDHPEDVGAAQQAPYLAGEVTPLLGPLSLLFGSGSPVVQEAGGAVEDLRRSAHAVKAGDRAASEDALAAGISGRARFEAAVLAVVE